MLLGNKNQTTISEISGSYVKAMLSFWKGKNCQTDLQSGFTILHPNQQWMSVPLILNAHQHLVLLMFWISIILQFADEIRCWVFFYILICHLYIFFCELSVHIICPFFNCFFCFSYYWIFKCSVYIWEHLKVCPWIYVLQRYSPNLYLEFLFLQQCLSQSRRF